MAVISTLIPLTPATPAQTLTCPRISPPITHRDPDTCPPPPRPSLLPPAFLPPSTPSICSSLLLPSTQEIRDTQTFHHLTSTSGKGDKK
ncbi:hypothetical protein E2C01_102227 [Portunus trituberculatus]|uniref:Uncharacterized protein n=1 Tax=Portunus trituberculatus TaxID=210409 RepID=A0A5B7KCL2_PORTR|nr:hypothetical protein [Portunus trituberculatus]